MAQSREVRQYLYQKYVSFGLMNTDGSEKLSPEDVNHFIYPNTGYIPYCKQCLSNYEAFKPNDKVINRTRRSINSINV